MLLVATTFAADTAAQALVSGVLLEIRQSQGVSANGNIDCDRVTPSQYERLGVAVMEEQLPDTADYNRMDNMMGGAASEVTRAFHRMVGARYLGCPYGGRAGFLPDWPGVMGGGTMGYGRRRPDRDGYHMRGPGMMGGWYGPEGPPVASWILGLLIIALLVAFVVVSAMRLSRRNAAESPRDILLRRYARGDITKEQYDQMKKDLPG